MHGYDNKWSTEVGKPSLLVAVTVRPPFAPSLWDGRTVELLFAETLVDLVVYLAQPELESFAALLDGLVRRIRLHVLL